MKKSNFFKILKNKHVILSFSLLFFLGLIYIVLYKIYIPRVNAFGCFDDCFNFMGGYFLLNDKKIYTDFFYNHQPMAAYISLLVQYFTNPESIYELVLRHRQFMLFFAFLFNTVLILRFGVKALIFAIIFEFSKFYLFGDRFLAEGMIVYPIIYLAGILFIKLNNQRIFLADYILAAVFSWFVIFSREPYGPLALFLYVAILVGKNFNKYVKKSLLIFVLLSLISVFSFNISDYFFNVINVNIKVVLPNEISDQLYGGPIEVFFYPIFIFLSNPQNIYKNLLIGIDIVFILFFLKLLIQRKYKIIFAIFIILGLANLKSLEPGKVFYEAFHMIVWYALFVFLTLSLIFQEHKNKIFFVFSLFLIFAFFTVFVTSSEYFAKEKINPHEEFITNYGQTLQEGEVIKLLSEKSDTLFIDGSDDLIYWQSQRQSPYKYTWYTSVMPYFDKYNNARVDMFKNNPPDFYRSFGSCQQKTTASDSYLLSVVVNNYVRLLTDGKPSCIYVSKTKLKQIPEKKLNEIKTWHYSL